jgi:hypothetical protein
MSYQNGDKSGGEQASLVAGAAGANKQGPPVPRPLVPPVPRVRPMSHLDRRRRRHMCCAMALVAIFVGGTIGLFAWILKRNESNPDFVNVATLALRAQDLLNRKMNKQIATVTPGCEATVLVMRHCEKVGIHHVDKDGNEHCSYVGMQRAYWLANNVFGTRWPVPSHLFALSVSRSDHLNFREYETLEPLSKSISVDITVLAPQDIVSNVFDLLQTGELCGKLAVISWKHEYITKLAPALGCGPEEGCPTFYAETSFDQIWQIKYVFRPPGFELKEEADKDRFTNDDDDDDGMPAADEHDTRRRRMLKKSNDAGDTNGWQVYGTVAYQNFDPLAMSYAVGDYPVGGVSAGGRWMPENATDTNSGGGDQNT